MECRINPDAGFLTRSTLDAVGLHMTAEPIAVWANTGSPNYQRKPPAFVAVGKECDIVRAEPTRAAQRSPNSHLRGPGERLKMNL